MNISVYLVMFALSIIATTTIKKNRDKFTMNWILQAILVVFSIVFAIIIVLVTVTKQKNCWKIVALVSMILLAGINGFTVAHYLTQCTELEKVPLN